MKLNSVLSINDNCSIYDELTSILIDDSEISLLSLLCTVVLSDLTV